MENLLNQSIEMIDQNIKELQRERFRKQMEMHQKKFPFYELQLHENRYLFEDVLDQLKTINQKFIQIIDCIEASITDEKLKEQSKDIRRNGDLLNEVCDYQIESAKNYIIKLSDLQRNSLKSKGEFNVG